MGAIHQALGHTDTALEFFELRCQLGKELYESNPKSVALKNGLAISYYKLGGIYTDKQQAQRMYQQAIVLWQELYELTHLEIYQNYINYAQSQSEP